MNYKFKAGDRIIMVKRPLNGGYKINHKSVKIGNVFTIKETWSNDYGRFQFYRFEDNNDILKHDTMEYASAGIEEYFKLEDDLFKFKIGDKIQLVRKKRETNYQQYKIGDIVKVIKRWLSDQGEIGICYRFEEDTNKSDGWGWTNVEKNFVSVYKGKRKSRIDLILENIK